MNNSAIMLLIASALSSLAVLYPYLIYPLILRLLPKRPLAVSAGHVAESQRYALLFCAFNEEKSLPAKIDNLRAIKALMPELEIKVYSDASTDATLALLQQASDVLQVVNGQHRQGKILGMRQLVESVDADIVILTDANVIIEPRTLPRLLQYFGDPEVGAVAGKLLYTNGKQPDAGAVAHVGSLYWRLEEHIKELESASGSAMGADGSLFARRRLGYPRVPPKLSDDMSVSMSVMFDGLRCISAPDVLAYENCVTLSAEEFLRKRRVSCRSYSTYRYFSAQIKRLPLLDRFKWFSHRVVRWWGGPLLIFAVASFIAGCTMAGYGVPAALSVAALSTATVLLGQRGVPFISAIYEVLMAITATTMGVFEALIGKSYSTWVPAASR